MNINPLINTYPANSKQKFRGQQPENNYKKYRQKKLDYSQKIDKWDYRHSQPHTNLQCLSLGLYEVDQKAAFYGGLPCMILAFSSLALSKFTKSSKIKKISGKVGDFSLVASVISFMLIFSYNFFKIRHRRLRECGFEK